MLVRMVKYLADEAGIRQFLDIGTGLPTASNTHEVARASPEVLRGRAESRIVKSQGFARCLGGGLGHRFAPIAPRIPAHYPQDADGGKRSSGRGWSCRCLSHR
jgi:hypothetical protein